jgi:putative membrane protein
MPLGTKVMGVPLMIGVNWCILIFITGFIAQFFLKKLWSKALLGTALMLTLDLVMEPVAPVLDFWTFTTWTGFFSQLFRMGFGCFSTTTCFSQSQN